jgi:hypothetical protein
MDILGYVDIPWFGFGATSTPIYILLGGHSKADVYGFRYGFALSVQTRFVAIPTGSSVSCSSSGRGGDIRPAFDVVRRFMKVRVWSTGCDIMVALYGIWI